MFIVTLKPEEVCTALSQVFEQGMTMVEAKGFYSHSQRTMVYIVLNRFQISRMKDLVHAIDPAAYITIHDVADVFKMNQDLSSAK